MGRIAKVLLAVSIVSIGVHLSAQQKAKPKIFLPSTYLGHSDKKGGAIRKSDFVALMKQGLTSSDSLGKKYRVVGFDFSYAEQKLYEDSAGNSMIVMDLSAEYCFGDTLSRDVAYGGNMIKSAYVTDSADIPRGVYDRVKPGDTLYFDHVRLEELGKSSKVGLSDTATLAGRGMKFYIVK